MMVAFRAAIEVLLELIRMDHLFALGALDPAAESIFFGGFNLNFRLMPCK